MSERIRWLDAAPTAASIAELAGEGVGAIGLPLHGARPEVHEWVAGAPGSFAQTLAAWTAARGVGVESIAWTRLTRSNARVLGELPSLLKARGVTRWAIRVPRCEGDDWTATVPRFGLAIPSALAAAERARRLGIDARIEGAPRCVLGRFADRALPSAPRAYAPVCDGCPSRARCPGVDPRYLERFGARELRPAPVAAPIAAWS